MPVLPLLGKRSEISSKRSIRVNDCDVNKARCRGNTSKIRSLNAYLDKVYTKLLDCQKQLFAEGKMVSANSIKARYLYLKNKFIRFKIGLNEFNIKNPIIQGLWGFY